MSILRVTIAIVVTALWAAVYTADILSEKFSAPPEISAPMLGVVTWLFGSEIKKQIKNGNGTANGAT